MKKIPIVGLTKNAIDSALTGTRGLKGMILAAALFLHGGAKAHANSVTLGTAANFAILAGSTIANTGATAIDGGNVGVFPGTTITGFPPGTIAPPFTTDMGDAAAQQAESDLGTAYNNAAALAPTENLTGQDLGGLTLSPGVYSFDSAAQLTGTLTLNDEGNPNAQFVFQIGSTLTTASDSSVLTINPGPTPPDINVFWEIGSSATLGTGTAFEGNILANASITANMGATDLDGRLLAENGAVTLNDNSITVPSVPDTGSTLLLLGSALATLMAFRRRLSALL